MAFHQRFGISGGLFVRGFGAVALGLLAFSAGCGSGAEEPPASGSGGGDSSQGGGAGTESAGCSRESSSYRPGTSEGVIDFGGRRSFRVFVPSGAEAGRPLPVVLVFHGGGGSAEQIQTDSARMDAIAEREGFLTVYPEGTGVLATWNGGLCCGRAVEAEVDDVGFVGALLDHLEAELCVDPSRVFATGMSNGAILSHRLACELSERIAAVAPVAGTIGVSDCRPTRAVPVMQIHGTDDGHVPWDGGVGCGPAGASFVSVPETMDGWRERNGCGEETTVTVSEGNGSCAEFVDCEAPVVLCTVEGGGHSWPGGVPKTSVVDCPSDGPQSSTFSASEVAWNFFAENPRR